MSDPVTHAVRTTSVVVLAASNAVAWVQGTGLGGIVTGLTIAGVAWISWRVRSIKEIEKARNEAWADRERTEMQIQSEREKLEATSLQAQIAKLQETVDENKRRTDDINQKLHDEKAEKHRLALLHSEETEQLREQITLLTNHIKEIYEERQEARQDNQALRMEVRALREEERRLLALVAIKQGQQDVEIIRNAAAHIANSEAIQDVSTRIEGLANPPGHPENNAPR